MNRTAALTIDEVTDEQALYALQGEWTELYERCAHATPFQSPAWSLAWWRRFRQGQLFTLALRLEGRLVGIAPFYIKNLGGSKRLLFFATGPSDYLDIIVEDGFEREAVALTLEHLLKRGELWDRCDLQEVRPSSPLMHARYPDGLDYRVEDMSVCPTLVLPPDAEMLERMLRRSHKKRHVRPMIGLERSDSVEFELASSDNLEEVLSSLFSMHDLRWELKGIKDVIRDERVRMLFIDAARSFLEMGILRLSRLKIRGRPAACLYSFVKGGSYYSFICGFDPQMGHLSPGKLVIDLMIKEAIKEGFKEFDFMRGNEPYKYFWEPSEKVNYRIVIEKGQG